MQNNDGKTPWKVSPEIEQAMKDRPEIKAEVEGIIQVHKNATQEEIKEKVRAYMQDKLGPNVHIGDIHLTKQEGGMKARPDLMDIFAEDPFQAPNALRVDQLLFNRVMFLAAKYDLDDALMFALILKQSLNFLRLAPYKMRLAILDEMYPRVRATFEQDDGQDETVGLFRSMLDMERSMAKLDPNFTDQQLEVNDAQVDFLRRFSARPGSRREEENKKVPDDAAGDTSILARAKGLGRKDN